VCVTDTIPPTIISAIHNTPRTTLPGDRMCDVVVLPIIP
jgi:hypothetical protein